MNNWDKQLQEQVDHRFDNAKKIHIDLATARTDQLYHIPGDYIYVEAASSCIAIATLKINKDAGVSMNLIAGTIIETVFNNFFVSNTALPGQWLDLVIGIDFKISRDFDAEDFGTAQPAAVITNVTANTNTVGAAAAVLRAVIKADVKNTGIAWVNFGAAAVQDLCMPLDPGESISIHLGNTNKINVNFEIAGEKVFITSES